MRGIERHQRSKAVAPFGNGIQRMGIGGFMPFAGVGFYVCCAVMRCDIETASRAMLPYLAMLIAGLLLVAFVPWFTLALPHVGLYAGAVLTVIIGLVISSTTSSIIVFAQELVPHRFGMISGVFFGVAFGIGGLGAAALGKLADSTSIEFVYQVCAFLPAIGLLTVFLPKMQHNVR